MRTTTKKPPGELKGRDHHGRNVRLVVYLSPDEVELIDRDLLPTESRSEYARTAVLLSVNRETSTAPQFGSRARAAIKELERMARA